MTTRRDFIYRSVLATAGLGLLGCAERPATENATTSDPAQMKAPLPYLDTIGIQLWTVREPLAADPRATLQALADLGYRQVELMDTRQIAELKPICDDVGLRINSSFMQWTAVTGRWDLLPDAPKITVDEVLEQANAGGLSHVVFGYLMPEEHDTADEWKQHIASLNDAGRKARAAGLQLAYHNHNFEWEPVDGTTGWQLLVDHLDGDLVPFELDLAWASMAGKDPSAVLASISDRVEFLHIKNLVELEQPYVTIESMPPDSFIELNKGRLDIPALMRQGQEAGVRYCFYEQDYNWHPDPLGSAKTSLHFLQT